MPSTNGESECCDCVAPNEHGAYAADPAVYLRPGGGCKACVTRCSEDVEPVRMLLLSIVAVTTGRDWSTLLACSSAAIEERTHVNLTNNSLNGLKNVPLK